MHVILYRCIPFILYNRHKKTIIMVKCIQFTDSLSFSKIKIQEPLKFKQQRGQIDSNLRELLNQFIVLNLCDQLWMQFIIILWIITWSSLQASISLIKIINPYMLHSGIQDFFYFITISWRGFDENEKLQNAPVYLQ